LYKSTNTDTRLAAWNFTSLVGLPVHYLNDIVNRCDLALIPDLLAFLREDWSRVYQKYL
jgi:hypothetical protein